ncbi:YihY/virulence factor BrkB family protein [Maritalea mediterranea]|uniref:YihY/virulence factor BrkB family protein n=1 Tax=Maritalea mediterranea TaxID=2909667 RepID=A0ABS9E9H9_9HYPH|nr:YihY/virulence factor BrkB family protein [Maritalea mediterranea]MCF4099537.1 YihY/virulence factor BrkB family protein [Maritalea mediterranea]
MSVMSLTRNKISPFKAAVGRWWANDPFTQSAAIAYYTIFSFPALIILYLGLASFFMDEAAVRDQVFGFLRENFGRDAADTFRTIVANTAPSEESFLPFIVAGVVLIYAALRLFLQLQKALNYIWDINDSDVSSFRALVVRRLMSFAVMIGVLFVLAISLVITSTISTLTEWLIQRLPDMFALLAHAINLVLSLLIISLLFAVILKMLPDRDISWPHVAPGALVAAALFMLGEYGMGVYFGLVEPGSAYGVTGAIILLMIWVFYSSAVFLLGAEYAKTLHQKSLVRKKGSYPSISSKKALTHSK